MATNPEKENFRSIVPQFQRDKKPEKADEPCKLAEYGPQFYLDEADDAHCMNCGHVMD